MECASPNPQHQDPRDQQVGKLELVNDDGVLEIAGSRWSWVKLTAGGSNWTAGGPIFIMNAFRLLLRWLPLLVPPPYNRCEYCNQYARVPFRWCSFCNASPSWHHGRCCPMRPWRRLREEQEVATGQSEEEVHDRSERTGGANAAETGARPVVQSTGEQISRPAAHIEVVDNHHDMPRIIDVPNGYRFICGYCGKRFRIRNEQYCALAGIYKVFGLKHADQTRHECRVIIVSFKGSSISSEDRQRPFAVECS